MSGVELFTIPALTAGGTATAVTLADTLMIGGTLLSGAGAISAGRSQAATSKFEAAQMDAKAGQERAAAQRQMMEERRRERLAQSGLQARAAASGAGALDPTVLDLSGDIAEEGEYRAMTALYEGEERARGLQTQAAATRYEGRAAKRAGYMKGAGTILGGGYSLLDKYG